ncbi:hypothetical protein [Paracoccus methylarcula]|uniref:Ferrochelatase n=1 Tax=Paracoccus methylarcula TaxID=72022 RepID=A0A422QZI3_9RHOB|nr:hypothetical protein [Paracoccus methylarcula]RNF35382.1 hypothetical protein A7A09_007290 [Paracoccus methylarcula]
MKNLKAFSIAIALAVSTATAGYSQDQAYADVVVAEKSPTSEVPTFVWTVIISGVLLALANDY